MNRTKLRELGQCALSAAVAVAAYIGLQHWDEAKAWLASVLGLR